VGHALPVVRTSKQKRGLFLRKRERERESSADLIPFRVATFLLLITEEEGRRTIHVSRSLLIPCLVKAEVRDA
jgi:hypothetical protein